MMEGRSLEEIVKNWKEQPKKLASELRDKYGEPNEACESFLIWYGNGPWKRTILRNEELEHNFPKPHRDSLENVIDYRIPPAKASDLAEFDGSVFFDRTKGEMSARCDKEATNYLALNLANDIVTGDMSVEEAREEYGRQIKSMMQGDTQAAPYTQDLQFSIKTEALAETADPDRNTIEI